MKRRACMLIAFLLAGAILNVAVAWGFPKLRGLVVELVSKTPPNPQPAIINFAVTFGSSADAFREFSLRDMPRFGWPCVTWNGAGHIYVVGSALNTLFYAAILWLLFAAPFKLRRWRRVKRGLCLACAYPIGVSEICTECGANLPPATLLAHNS